MKTSNYDTIPDTNAGAISISRSMPRGSHYLKYPALNPGPWFKSVSEAEYRKLYGEILAGLDPQTVWDELHLKVKKRVLAGCPKGTRIEDVEAPEVILLCWEKPEEFCHRRLVAAWLESHLGVIIPEVGH